MEYYNYLIFGVLPSIAWLIFYLRKDSHPEPKTEILWVFFLGAFSTIPALFLEFSLVNVIKALNLPPFFTIILVNVLGVAFIEEFVKYGAVWVKEQRINQNAQLDEPVDFVIYMIISALGFAAVENLLFLLPIIQLDVAITTSLFRALSAILLHTLCSGTIGYFLALSFCDRANRRKFIVGGFAIASFLHGLYNLFIIKSEENTAFLLIPLLILSGLAFFLYSRFKKLKKMNSVCRIDGVSS